MARSNATQPNNLIRAPAASGEEVISRPQVQVQPAPPPLPARRLNFRRQPPQAPPSPPTPRAQAHPNNRLAGILDFQIEKADECHNHNLLALGPGAANFSYAGQYIFGHPPEFGVGAVVSASSADGFQARDARMEAFFPAERDAPVNLAPAISAFSTSQEAFAASQARAQASKRPRKTLDLLSFFGRGESETMADNFSGAESSSAAASRPAPPLLLKHFMEMEPRRRGHDGAM